MSYDMFVTVSRWVKWWYGRGCDVVEINDAKYNVGTLERLYEMLVAEGIIKDE